MRGWIGFLLLWLCLTTSAFADTRVALVIGNSNYSAVGFLPNPRDDAALVADTLGAEGFKVTLVQDAKREGMLAALNTFEDAVDQADWALVYYAGHGIEVGGINYLLPTDVRLRTDRDAEDEAVPLTRVLQTIEKARKLRIVILDACRNNPFAATMKSFRTREVQRGLAAPEPKAGILVVYVAEAGHAAVDGTDAHSPFTAALAKRMREPGLEMRHLFDVVTRDVLDATGDNQRPYQYGSNPSREPFYFTPPMPVVGAPSADDVIVATINAAKTADQLEPLISTLPDGPLKEQAKARAASLKKLANLPPQPPNPSPTLTDSSVYEQTWRSVKSSTDLKALKTFLDSLPTDSPLREEVEARIKEVGSSDIQHSNLRPEAPKQTPSTEPRPQFTVATPPPVEVNKPKRPAPTPTAKRHVATEGPLAKGSSVARHCFTFAGERVCE